MLIITVSNAKNHSNILKYFCHSSGLLKRAIMCGKLSKTLDFNPWDFLILNFLIDFRAICVHMQVARLCRMKLDKKCNLIPHSDFFWICQSIFYTLLEFLSLSLSYLKGGIKLFSSQILSKTFYFWQKMDTLEYKQQHFQHIFWWILAHCDLEGVMACYIFFSVKILDPFCGKVVSW